MEPPATDPPYRTELASAYERIAQLERQLATLTAAAGLAPPGALAQLRLTHLREDRELAVARYRGRRSVAFVVTAAGMLATFAAAWVRLWSTAAPAAVAGWALCGAAVTSIALLGWIAQRVLRARAANAVRALDRRIAEAQLVTAASAERASGSGEGARVSAERASRASVQGGVRVAVEPAGLDDATGADDDALLTGGASATRERG